MKKYILAFLLGGIVFSGIGVFAGSYKAKDVTYTPSDNAWNVNNVSSALDNIKQTDKTEITNLQSSIANKNLIIEEKNNTIGSLNSQIEDLSKYTCVSKDIEVSNSVDTATGYPIWIGFKAKIIHLFWYKNNEHFSHNYYNEDISTTVLLCGEGIAADVNQYISIDSTSITLKNYNFLNGGWETIPRLYYLVCK